MLFILGVQNPEKIINSLTSPE